MSSPNSSEAIRWIADAPPVSWQLYEAARYTPDSGLPPDAIRVAQREVGLLASAPRMSIGRQLLRRTSARVLCVAVSATAAQSPELDNHAFRLILESIGPETAPQARRIQRKHRNKQFSSCSVRRKPFVIPIGLRNFVEAGGAV